MKTFLEHLIKGLVDRPDQVLVSEIYGARNVTLEVRCHADDMGRIIGKNGKTIGAMRVLLSSLAAKQGRKALLEVVE